MQSIDYTMNGAPSPSFGDPNSGGTTPGAGAALSSLQDFLASQQLPGNMQSPSGDFADLLAEFTLPNNALSPETLGKSPEPFGAGDMEGIAFGASFGSTARQREKSAQEVLLEQLGFPVSHLAPNLGQDGASSSKEQVNQALASLDAGTRAQLLNALLTLKQEKTSGSPAASNPSPRAAAVNSPHPLNSHSPRYHEQPSQGSPLAYSSQPPSQHNSPQPFQSYNSPVPHPLQQQHIPHSQAPYQPLPAALAASLPPSAVSSPVGSPYIHATNPQNYYAPTPGPQVPSSPFVPASYQNAFSPRPFDSTQQSQSPAMQTQLAMDMLARVNGQGVPDMAMRGGSATGGSYATNPEGEDWGETDFMFSPLMSPALTPQSVFTQASSLPTSSASYLPSGSLVSPAEFFSPLGSPAIMPQQFQDDPAQWQQQQQHRNSLQGLVDQTRALGFDTNLAGMQVPPPYGSPSSYFPQGQPGMSPRLGPNDAGQGTGAGSGRRGAGSKKARPSPLLKPTPDGGAIRRKKAGPAARSASISSANGARSATTSPFLGPTGSKANSVASGGHAHSQSQSSGSASGSQKATPPEENSNGINTPSPVDLAMGEINTSLNYQPELMGPPPPPSADSRRQSLNGSNANEWIGPVTPASFMNLPNDFNVNDLSALTPGLPPTVAPSSQPYDVAVSTPLPPLAPRPTLPNLPSTSSAPPAIATAPARPKQPKLVPKPPADPDLPVNGGSSPVLSATKGKGRAGAAGAAGRKATGKAAAKPSPKVGPTTKIKPLLANGAAPDAMNRLSSKSNYQNIVEGHGELLGLDAQTVTALNSSQAGAAGADNRRTSHKAAEQKRRDSLKARFEELRVLLPPIALSSNEERRPGEGNVGGQRSGSIDPDNPNRGVSKVALLRRSNEYMGMLLERVERRDMAIEALRAKMNELRSQLGIVEDDEEVPGLDLDNIDRDEREAGTMAFYENLSDDDEPTPKVARKASTARRKSSAADGAAKPKATGARRSTRKAAGAEEDIAMEVEV